VQRDALLQNGVEVVGRAFHLNLKVAVDGIAARCCKRRHHLRGVDVERAGEIVVGGVFGERVLKRLRVAVGIADGRLDADARNIHDRLRACDCAAWFHQRDLEVNPVLAEQCRQINGEIAGGRLHQLPVVNIDKEGEFHLSC